MSRRIRSTAWTTIDREAEEVFAFVSDPKTMDDWVVGVGGTTLVSGDAGTEGAVYEYDYTYGGRTVPMTVELAAVEAPSRVAMRSLEGPFPFESELVLVPEDGGTRVENTIDAGSDSRFTTVLFALLSPVMRWLMRRRLDAELEDLKRLLESGAGSAPTGEVSEPGSKTPA